VAGLGSSKTRLTGDFEQYTRFLLIRQSLESLSDAWDGWRREAQEGDLGVQFVRVGWLFQAVRETVAMFRAELDEIGLGDATRWTLQVAFNAEKSDEPQPSLSLGSFLDIIDVEALRWSQLLSDSGSDLGEHIQASQRSRMGAAGREILRWLGQPHILRAGRQEFEGLLISIGEFCEEWLTSADSLGAGETVTRPQGVLPFRQVKVGA
jgi:hypothetical protein